MTRTVLILLSNLLMITLLGCTSQRAVRPGQTVDSYIAAVESRDANLVYALLDDEARRGMDPETFARYFEENYASIARQAEQLRAGSGQQGQPEVRALVPTGPGDRALLVWIEGAWWMGKTSPTKVSQESPQQTVEALRAALDARNLEAVFVLLSAQTRAGYLAELEALGTALGESGGKMVAAGDAAVYVLSSGDQIHLVREDGVWRVHRVEQVAR